MRSFSNMAAFPLLLLFAIATVIAIVVPAEGWEWAPTDEELAKYRKSWNPMANGPILLSGVDIQPKGQFLFQPFILGKSDISGLVTN